MNSYDSPETIEARKSVFSIFNKLRIQEEKKKFNVEDKETTKDSQRDPWACEAVNDAWHRQQLEYTKPYVENYNAGPSNSKRKYLQSLQAQRSDETPQQTETNNAKDNKDDAGSELSSASRPSALLNRLASLRGRPRGLASRIQMGRINEAGDVPVRQAPPSTCGSTLDFDSMSSVMPLEEANVNQDLNSNVPTAELRSQYFTNYRSNSKLPIYKHRAHIINSISAYSVVIIEGSTGCGKTTQVPLYILEDAVCERPSERSPVIYVTQPRRIAARSIAERVCSEHNWQLGSIVGYQVGLDKVAGPNAVLMYCTAGVLLQKIIQERSLKNYSHIIIDEAHERDADTDLLLMMIRKLMVTETPIFRLVIMSATMDTEKLRNYYTFKTMYGHHSVTKPALIKIGDQRQYNDVQVVYYDKFNHLFDVIEKDLDVDLDNPELLDKCLRTAVQIVVDVVPHLDNFTEESKSTLVFLPGMAEISKLDRMIRQCPGAEDHLDIIPLHSCLSSSNQLRVFKPSPPGTRKVILATNIAESSITVSDIGFIVDFCLTKVLMKDSVTRFPTLKLVWSTQDKCTQRAGRTGRCCPGKVFRMLPQATYRMLDEYAEPEILVAPLELSVLRVKNFNMGELQGLFAVLMDPPPFEEIRTAIMELKQIGALSATHRGIMSDLDGDLTNLGRIISALPIDVHLSKLVVIANVFDVLEDAIIVAACLSTNRTIVKHLYRDPLESYERKLDWAVGSNSDLFVSLEVYREYCEQKTMNRSDAWLASWCNKKALDERKLHEVHSLVEELIARLANVNIAIPDQPNRERKSDEDMLMLKVAFCAAFYPNYFLNEPVDVDKVARDLCGLDPARTVVLHNMPVNTVPLYKSVIEKPIKQHVSSNFSFLADCSRALLLFHDPVTPQTDPKDISAIGVDGIVELSSGVSRSVFRAIKCGDYLELNCREFTASAAEYRMVHYNAHRQALQQAMDGRMAPHVMKVVDGQPNNDRLRDADYEEYIRLAHGPNFYVEVPFNRDQDELDNAHLQQLQYRDATLGFKIEPRKHNSTCQVIGEDKSEENNDEGYDPIFRDRTHVRRIRGPDSPVRMTFRSVLAKSQGFVVDVDPGSVNAILLNPDYTKDRRQMLIAATVAQTKRNRVMARDTTLMPNIRGLPSLMGLLFAQYFRLVFNKSMNCVAGAVFGIGWNASDKPLDKQYEVHLGFDVHITRDDIELINQARQRISDLLNISALYEDQPRSQVQLQLRSILLKLLRKQRYPIKELDVSLTDYMADNGERVFCKDKHNSPQDTTNSYQDGQDEEEEEEENANGADGDDDEEDKSGTKAAANELRLDDTKPFLPPIKISRKLKELDMFDCVRDNLSQMESIKRREEKIPPNGIKCLVCGNGVHNFMTMFNKLVDHLGTEQHKKMLDLFELFESRARERAQG